jgi:hypothetical protein
VSFYFLFNKVFIEFQYYFNLAEVSRIPGMTPAAVYNLLRFIKLNNSSVSS